MAWLTCCHMRSSDAMDMHMYGFKTVWSSDTSCIVLFFSSWTLDTKVRPPHWQPKRLARLCGRNYYM